jgi:hypothetical protein
VERQTYQGAPLYVTFALGAFGDAAAVRTWCAERLPGLSPEERNNQCTARRLRHPSQENR